MLEERPALPNVHRKHTCSLATVETRRHHIVRKRRYFTATTPRYLMASMIKKQVRKVGFEYVEQRSANFWKFAFFYHMYCCLLSNNPCRMYNVFGSGSNQGIYAQFMAQSSLTHGGPAVGLLRGAET